GQRLGRGRSSRASAPAGDAEAPAGGAVPSAMGGTLDAWDEQLAHVGAELLAARLTLVRALRPHVAAAYAAVSGDRGPAGISYRPSFPLPGTGEAGLDEGAGAEPDSEQKPADLEPAMREALQQARPQELERGVCLV